MLEKTNILVVGCGSMASAMIKGWAHAGVAGKRFTVVAPREASVQDLRTVAQIDWYTKPEDLPTDFHPDAVIMAVKPQVMPTVVRAYFPYALEGSLMISVAAGLTLDFYKPFWGESAKIFRVMPNLPVAFNKGVCFGYANPSLDSSCFTYVHSLFSSLGKMLWLKDESKFDVSSAISGCGPAYAYLLVEAMTQAGAYCGLDLVEAESMARQTIIGAGVLLDNSMDSAAVLKKKVASPGGVTQAALDVLEKPGQGLPDLMRQAIQAAVSRSKELSNG
ncbi:MAG: pyrroline-5-carboxylate reductase [Alphaproteobacteria bacterium]|nr:pyrroline-5-carboxylate reductase [Alphaproteobacteria bacterium]